MTPTTLRAVTLKTVANYTHVAERTLAAYRVGGQRLIAVVQRGLDTAAARSPAPLAGLLRSASGRAGRVAGHGLTAVSQRAGQVIDLSSNGINRQLRRAAGWIEGVENTAVQNSLQAVARISLPGAQVALALSERVAAGADKLPGQPLRKASRRVKAAELDVAGVAGAVKRAVTLQRDRVAKLDAALAATITSTVASVGRAKKSGAKAAAEAVATVMPTAAKPVARKPAPRKSVRAVKAAQAVKAVQATKPSRARRAAKATPQASAAVAADTVAVSV